MATKKKAEKSVPVEQLQEIVQDMQSQSAQANATPDANSTPAEGDQQAPQQGQVQVNVDFLRTTKVHIAMPCYGGMLTESTFMSFIKWANTARQLGIDWTLETMVNESLISRARNTLTAKFLEQEGATHSIIARVSMQFSHNMGLSPTQATLLIEALLPTLGNFLGYIVNGFSVKDSVQAGLIAGTIGVGGTLAASGALSEDYLDEK